MEFESAPKRNETHSPPPFGRENQRLISVPYLLSKPETLLSDDSSFR